MAIQYNNINFRNGQMILKPIFSNSILFSSRLRQLSTRNVSGRRLALHRIYLAAVFACTLRQNFPHKLKFHFCITGAFILTDIPLGQSFTYQIPCVERPSTTNDTEFFRLPITTRYANIKYRASWQDPIVVFFVLISREYPRLGSFDYSLERVFNNTEISVTVRGPFLL